MIELQRQFQQAVWEAVEICKRHRYNPTCFSTEKIHPYISIQSIRAADWPVLPVSVQFAAAGGHPAQPRGR